MERLIHPPTKYCKYYTRPGRTPSFMVVYIGLRGRRIRIYVKQK